jgi:hypothetical protein
MNDMRSLNTSVCCLSGSLKLSGPTCRHAIDASVGSSATPSVPLIPPVRARHVAGDAGHERIVVRFDDHAIGARHAKVGVDAADFLRVRERRGGNGGQQQGGTSGVKEAMLHRRGRMQMGDRDSSMRRRGERAPERQRPVE